MRVKILASLSLFAILIFFVFAFKNNAFRQKQQTNPRANWPTRGQLWDSMFRRRGMLTLYSAGDAKIAAEYRDYYQNLPQRGPEWPRREYLGDMEFPPDSLSRRPLAVVGAINTNQILQRLLPQLPIERLPEGFRFRGQNYRAADDILALTYPNPLNPTQALFIVTGNSDRAILDSFRKNSRRWRRAMGDYHIEQQGQTILYGYFQDSGPGAWDPDSGREYDLRRSEKPAKTTAHFNFVTHGKSFSPEAVEKLAARYEENLNQIGKRLAVPQNKLKALPRLAVHLWERAEEKGMFTFNTDLRHLDTTRNEVHLLCLPNLRGDDFFAEASWFIPQLLGASKSAALQEGLAVAFSEQWRGVGYSGWAARLVQTQNAPPLAELFDNRIRLQESELVRQPLLGSFAAFLLEKFGAEGFFALYREWPETGAPNRFANNAAWEDLISEWQNDLQAAPAIPLRHAQPPKISARDFHRGFCYAHEGYDIHNGYLGNASRQALEKLAALSVNAISITPFGFMRDPNAPAFPGRSTGPNGESDESVIVAKNFAREYRMRAMLKPHIWMGRGWPGDIDMPTPAAWKTFFDYYDCWMRGYAVLAEMYDFDILCVGVEMAKTTVGHEQEWRAMIKRWRGIYSGPMVYAANWGQEFETVKFWEALDAIGIDCYYPLSTKDDPTEAELLAGAKMVVEKIRAVAIKYNKPVLVTEIGFTSSSQPWKNPHQEDRQAAADLEAQRRCYEAIFQAFFNSGANNNWLAGMYWWKWPSTLEEGGPRDRQFTPNGKPAAQVAAKWYKQLAREFPASGQ